MGDSLFRSYFDPIIVDESHFRRAWSTEPEVFYVVSLRLNQNWAFWTDMRMLVVLHHEDFAFTQINQGSRAGWICTFSEHISSFSGQRQSQSQDTLTQNVDAQFRIRVVEEICRASGRNEYILPQFKLPMSVFFVVGKLNYSLAKFFAGQALGAHRNECPSPHTLG